jgi:hypothetical protein
MNPGAFDSFWLLAQLSQWRHLGDRFGGGHAGLDAIDILSLIAVIVLAVLGVFVLQRYAPNRDRPGRFDDPRQLFRELCRAHGLGRASRRLLKRLAAWRGLSDPALVFVMPECFDTDALPPELGNAAHELAQLRTRLFQTV